MMPNKQRMHQALRAVCAIGMLAGAAYAQAAKVPAPTHQQLVAARRSSDDWLLVNNDYAGQRFSAATQITPFSVRRLRPVCHVDLGVTPPFQTNPIVHNGIVYITTTSSTIAFRGDDCSQLWRHDR